MNEFPKPIAKVYARAVSRTEDFEAARLQLDLLEVTLQYLALVATARYWARKQPVERVDAVLLQTLAKPTLGLWKDLLCKLNDLRGEEDGTPAYLATGSDLKSKRDMPGFEALLKQLGELKPGARFNALQVLDRLIKLRNDASHGKLQTTKLASLKECLQATLEDLLFEFRVLQTHRLVVLDKARLQPGGVAVEYRSLRGEGTAIPEQRVFPPRMDLYEGYAYLVEASDTADPVDGQASTAGSTDWLALAPLIVVHDDEVFLLSGTQTSHPFTCPYAPQLGFEDEKDNLAQLRKVASFLFESTQTPPTQTPPTLDRLQGIVEGIAADGIITPVEIDVLRAKVVKIGLAENDDDALAIAREAIEKFANGAVVQETDIAVAGEVEQATVDDGPQSGSGGRRKWTAPRFFEHAATQQPPALEALRSVYDRALKHGAEITWGTGSVGGSYNIKLPWVAQRSFLTFRTNGSMCFNFPWLDESANATRMQQVMAELVPARLGMELPDDWTERYVGVLWDAWVPKVDAVLSILDELVARSRALEAGEESSEQVSDTFGAEPDDLSDEGSEGEEVLDDESESELPAGDGPPPLQGSMARLAARAKSSGVLPLFERMRTRSLALVSSSGRKVRLRSKKTQINVTIDASLTKLRTRSYATILAVSTDSTDGALHADFYPQQFELADPSGGPALAALLAFCESHGTRKTLEHAWNSQDVYRLALRTEEDVDVLLAALAKASPVANAVVGSKD